MMENKKLVLTLGEKLAAVCTLELRSGISRIDFDDMQALARSFNGEPEKATIIEFDEKQAQRINTLYYQFFEV